jgi:hypothetical protein
MKGSMLPIAGSINDEHQIPGEPGDEIRTYVNDGLGGYFNISVFDETTLRWEPDLTLRVAEGFWITRKESSDWVRFFIVQ